MKIVYFFTLMTLLISRFVSPVFADTVTFNFENNTLTEDKTITVMVKYTPAVKTARVRPQVNKGIVYIYNSQTKSWVSGKDKWTNMPKLNSKLKLKILTEFYEPVELFFQIQNAETTRIYETEKHMVWTTNNTTKYINSVNNSLIKTEQKAHETNLEIHPANSKIAELQFSNKKYLLMYFAIFTASAILGYKISSMKMVKLLYE